MIQSQNIIDTFLKDVQAIRDSIADRVYDQATHSEANSSTGKIKRKRGGQTDEAAFVEACDIIMQQVQDRFGNNKISQALKIIDQSQFNDYKTTFPTNLVDILCEEYPMIEKSSLISELELLYSSSIFTSTQCSTPQKLLNFITSIKLEKDLVEVSNVLQIVLTTPPTTSQSERSFSTLKRVKNISRTTMGQTRLNSLAFLTIHKDIPITIQDFKNKVIDKFAGCKERRADFFYC